MYDGACHILHGSWKRESRVCLGSSTRFLLRRGWFITTHPSSFRSSLGHEVRKLPLIGTLVSNARERQRRAVMQRKTRCQGLPSVAGQLPRTANFFSEGAAPKPKGTDYNPVIR